MIEERTADADCVCSHAAHWHLKHASGREHHTIRLTRCLSKVKNVRGFPTNCGCRAYRADTIRVAVRLDRRRFAEEAAPRA